MKIQAKVTSDKPAYKEKKKTDTGYVWVYDEKHVEKRWEEKKEKLSKLEKGIKKLREKYEKDLSSDDPRTRAIAAVVGLMDQTAMRVGNEESARDADTYGATTLKVKHVKINGSKVTFDFPGKGAVEQNVELEDAKVVKVLKELMENKKDDDFVFEVEGKKIWDRAINRYLSPLDISAKDLRGYRANVLMKEMLKKEKDFDKALDEVAEIVGHKASTLKNQYLDPELVEKYSKKEASLSIRARKYKQVQQSDLGGEELQSIYQPITSFPNEKTIDPNRNVSNIESKISPRGQEQVKITPQVAVAWRILAPFLPLGATLSSGFRSEQDQANTINNHWNRKWNGYFARNFPNRGKTIEDMQRFMNDEYDPKKPGTPPGGPSKAETQIDKPGESRHQSSAAMDVHGINYDNAAKIIAWMNKNMADFVNFSSAIEGDHIHVSVNKAIYPGPENMMAMLRQYYSGTKPSLYVSQSFEPALSKRALLNRDDLGYFRQKMQEIGGAGATGGGLALSKMQKQQMRISPNAKPNQLILSAWRSLLPFLPAGATMTSGERTSDDQLRIIDNYWRKAGGPADYPNITDPHQKARILTNEYGYVVGGPTSDAPRSHLKGNAFDISGADLDEIVEAIQTVSRHLPIKLRPQIERRNNAVHVGIESATYDAEAVAQLAQQMGTRVAMHEYHMLVKNAYEDLVDSDAPSELIEAFDPETDAKERGKGTPDLPGDWFEKSPMFRHREDIPEYDIHSEDSPAQLAKNDPESFFYRGLHKSNPDLEKGALEKMLEHNAKFYFIFNYHEREDKDFLDLLQTAAEKLSQQDARAFFYFHLHKKFPELGRGAIVQLIDNNPDSFFDLGLDKEYPDYTESANAARNIKDPNKVELELDQLEQLTSGASNPFLSKRAGDELAIVQDPKSQAEYLKKVLQHLDENLKTVKNPNHLKWFQRKRYETMVKLRELESQKPVYEWKDYAKEILKLQDELIKAKERLLKWENKQLSPAELEELQEQSQGDMIPVRHMLEGDVYGLEEQIREYQRPPEEVAEYEEYYKGQEEETAKYEATPPNFEGEEGRWNPDGTVHYYEQPEDDKKELLQLQQEPMKLSSRAADKPKAGVFITLPSSLAKKFPSLGEHDDSKPHVTVLFIGAVPKGKHDVLVDTVKEVAAKTEPFELELDDKASYFPASKHSDDCKVAKVGIVSSDLRKLHKTLKAALAEAGVDIDDHWPDYKPHITLEYMEPPKVKYEDDVPAGSWTAKEIEIWGAGSKKTIPLGKN